MNKINVSLTLTNEEIRIICQALNEICNGIHFEDSEFETRIGTDKETGRKIMSELLRIYDSNEKDTN